MGYSMAVHCTVQWGWVQWTLTVLGSMVNKKRISNNKSMTTNKNDFRNPSENNLKYKLLKEIYAFKWHMGHKRRLQLTTKARSLSKCFFSSVLHSTLFHKILIFSLLNSSQVVGKLIKGCLEREDNLVNGTKSWWLLRRIRRCMSSGLLSSFVNQTPLNDSGKKPWMKCYINWK